MERMEDWRNKNSRSPNPMMRTAKVPNPPWKGNNPEVLTLNSAPLVLRPHPGQLARDQVGAGDSVVEGKIVLLAEMFG